MTNTKPIPAYLVEIAKALGPDWHVEPSPNWHDGKLVNNQIMILAESSSDRIRLSHYLPYDYLQHEPYGMHTMEITVSKSRPVGQIAKEIMRRLVPKAKKLVEKTLENKARHDAFTQQESETINLLRAALPDDDRTRVSNSTVQSTIGKTRLAITVSGDSVHDITIDSLSPSLTIAIITFLRNALETKVKLYECGICGYLHLWDWEGDCRDDANRYTTQEDYASRNGIGPDQVDSVIEVYSWEDRLEAD